MAPGFEADEEPFVSPTSGAGPRFETQARIADEGRRLARLRQQAGRARQMVAAAQSAGRIYSRRQFERLFPERRYGDYIEYRAGQAGVSREVLLMHAPDATRGQVRQVVRMRQRTIDRWFSGGGGGDTRSLASGGGRPIDVVIEWPPGTVPPALSDAGKALLREAQRWLGDPYLWGGGHAGSARDVLAYGNAGPRGAAFDCSGFTRYLYLKTLGVDVGTYTGTQRYAGRSVRGQPLQVGDLVFFGSDYGHMGMYIGNGQFIHAPSTGDVIKISRLADRSDLVEVRRVLPGSNGGR